MPITATVSPNATSEPRALMNEARQVLRQQFLSADVGITGGQLLHRRDRHHGHRHQRGQRRSDPDGPRVRIALAASKDGADPETSHLDPAADPFRHWPRSPYTTFSSGPRRPDDLDGPEQFHVVLLDNGRSGMLGGEFQDMLRCIRCSACMNHCPVYGAIGGHAYGWVYPGPMGSVLTRNWSASTPLASCRTPPRSAVAARKSARCISRCRK